MSTHRSNAPTSKPFILIFFCLAALNVLMFQAYQQQRLPWSESATVNERQASLPVQVSSSTPPPLGIPEGEAVALPSVRITDQENSKIKRDLYGGDGDKPHLGGFVEIDLMGVSPSVWKHMVERLGVKSLLDVGCGRGISTSWFVTHGVDTLCVEGSHDAVEKSLVPSITVEHDFSRGPWWPPQTVDAVWCVEFLEHVGRNYMPNYITAFRKAAIIFVTSSSWGGWHHVEVHPNDWWILKLELLGFRYSEILTNNVRIMAKTEKNTHIKAPNGEEFNAQHVWLNMKVFINPQVASLPQHAHLMAEHGCYRGRNKGTIVNRKCNTGSGKGLESTLPESFHPLQLTPQMDEEWEDLIKKNINLGKDESDKK